MHDTTALTGIRPLRLGQTQDAIAPLHAYLRTCILDTTLQPGTKLSQVALARQLGVSRTPLREVLRMLQEEGLVQIEHNQRTRVTTVEAGELDLIYSERIVLEPLALSMTAERFGPCEHREAHRLVSAMRRTLREQDMVGWRVRMIDLQVVLRAGAPESLRRQLATMSERTSRYVYAFGDLVPVSLPATTTDAHAAIIAALAEDDLPTAQAELCEMLAHNASALLGAFAPDYVPAAVPHAHALMTGRIGDAVELLFATG